MNQKSTLLAALLMSAYGFAVAQSSVTVYGAIDAFAGRMTGPATGVNSLDKPIWKVEGGGLSTSHLGFRGVEDLGGGLSAQFDMATFLRNDTGVVGRGDAVPAPVNVAADTFWSRAAWVGLASKDLGRVRLGNITNLLFFNSIMSNAFGDSTVFGPLNLVAHIGNPQAGGTGWTNSIVYDSPNISGVVLSLQRSVSENQGGANSSVRLAYAQGPFAANLTWQSVKKDPTTFADGTSRNNVKTWILGGSYDFQVAKVYAHVGRLQNDGTEAAPLDVSYRIAEVSAQVPIGSGNLLAGYAQRKTGGTPAVSPATVAGGSIKREVLTVGYDYNFSKRTDVYAIVMNDKTQTLTLPFPFTNVGANGTSYGVGIRHRF
ncbi:porin [Roseateles sp. P5_E4]